jgi:choline dehydrogenase-like flavoprotein
MTLIPNNIVASIIYDDKSGRATGVNVIDTVTKQTTEYFARVLFLNASTLATTGILLNSKSRRFPNGLGNDSGELGHNLMDHHFTSARGRSDELAEQYYRGRRPVTLCMPPFRNVTEQRKDYTRVFHVTAGGYRSGWWRTTGELGLVGASLKKALSEPGAWNFGIQAYGECLPYHDNRVSLSPDKKDAWGLPQLSIHCEFKENEARMGDDMRASALEMLEALGMKDVRPRDGKTIPGHIIHEMGTARMGKSPKTSVLNGDNQVHAAKNVFVTDGSCMASSASQNPSLTYMALTARAAAFAVSELKQGRL